MYLICAGGATSAAFVLGCPTIILPLPGAAAYFACHFWFHQTQWQHYVAFASCLVLTALWWLVRSFWSVDFEFDLTILPLQWTLNLQHATVLIAVLLTVSLCVVPLGIRNSNPVFTSISLVLQALLVAFLEQLLYEQNQGFYPPFLVILSSALGIYLSMAMLRAFRIDVHSATLLISIYASKVSMFLAPHRMAILAALLFSLSFVRLYLASKNGEKISPAMGWTYVLLSGTSIFLTRHVILAEALKFLFETRSLVSDSRLTGAFLFVWGASIVPLSYGFMKRNKLLKRITVLLLLFGTVWAFWQPSLSFG